MKKNPEILLYTKNGHNPQHDANAPYDSFKALKPYNIKLNSIKQMPKINNAVNILRQKSLLVIIYRYLNLKLTLFIIMSILN
jgi:hypothetical protein